MTRDESAGERPTIIDAVRAPPPRAVAGELVAERYRLRALLGRGGHGEVWEADDALAGSIVAIKLIPLAAGDDVARVQREAAALRLLRLPGVVRMLDEGLDLGRAFLVMERVAGRPFPGTRTPCRWRTLARPAAALLETLARVHAAGVVHRDLKPANVLVDAHGRAVVLDFGVAHGGTGRIDDLARAGEFVGTPLYAAPELAHGGTPSVQTDLYSVGVLLYEALAGRVPHADADRTAVLRELRPDVPRRVAEAITALLATDPRARPASASDTLRALHGARRVRREGTTRSLDVARAAVHADRSVDARGVVLEEAELRVLFEGPDRVLHLREDAARVLFARTEGDAARVVDELRAWVQAGLCRWSGETLAIDRAAIEWLEAGADAGVVGAGWETEPLSSRANELLAWVALAGPRVPVVAIGAAMGAAAKCAAADLEELVRSGAVARRADDTLVVRRASASLATWSYARRRAAHAALAAAMAVGAEGRLWHLLASGDGARPDYAVAVADEALALARRLAKNGYLSKAMTALDEALRAVRRARVSPRNERALLALWVEVALADNTPGALDRVLYAVCRAGARSPEIERLEGLVRAAQAVNLWTERALAQVEALSPFDDLALERCRQEVRVAAARRCSLQREEEVLADVARWVRKVATWEVDAQFAGWIGRLRYRQGRFDQAAQLQAEAATGATWIVAEAAARLNAASALMEAFRLDEARAAAVAAHELARQCRHTLFEGRAEWLLRCLAFRTGAADAPDFEFVAASARVKPDLEARACLNEGVIAYHAGHAGDAAKLVSRARSAWEYAPNSLGAPIAEALALALGLPAGRASAPEIAQRVLATAPPGVAVQTIALLHRARCVGPAERAAAIGLASRIPRSHWGYRREVLSVAESLADLVLEVLPPRHGSRHAIVP